MYALFLPQHGIALASSTPGPWGVVENSCLLLPYHQELMPLPTCDSRMCKLILELRTGISATKRR